MEIKATRRLQTTAPPIDYGPTDHNHGFPVAPRWFECPATEFERVWLPAFDNGDIPRPTQEELNILDGVGVTPFVMQRFMSGRASAMAQHAHQSPDSAKKPSELYHD